MPASRFDAQQGDTVRLAVRIQRNSAPFDPFSLDGVEIRRRTSATTDVLIDTVAAGAIVREAVGAYYVDWPIPLAEPVGAHVDRWLLVENSGDAQTNLDADFVVFAAGSISAPSTYQTVAEIRE